MDYQKYFKDLVHYQYMLGDSNEVDEFLIVAA